MPVHTIIFASSLVAIAAFFALKEREVYAGDSTPVTRVFRRFSPTLERRWHTFRALVVRTVAVFATRVAAARRSLWSRTVITCRWLVVLLADKMIRAVRGEKLLEMRGAPSVFLKRLRDPHTKL